MQAEFAPILDFMRRHTLAVQASVSPEGRPQAAVVGVVVDEQGQFFFDTLATSRKCESLRRQPHIALVIGWDLEEGCTAQVEGIADEPEGEELERLLALYLPRFPDGEERRAWPDITYFRVRPTWVRFSDFSVVPPRIVEVNLGAS